MSVNGVSNTQSASVYTGYDAGTTAKAAETTVEKAPEAGVVYEKSDATTSNATYSVNKMNKEQRSALVQQLKADQESRQQSLMSIVKNMLGQQAKTDTIAGAFSMDDDSVWKMFAEGNFTVDEAAQKQAQEDISEDGYWGVKQTSQRMFDFASALAGDDVEQMKEMQKAMAKGFDEATKAWGRDLPDISSQTMDAANKLFDEYYKAQTQ